ncbi:MAG: hypothetical protein IT337_12480 [Thermomicrobiales bacterium]|nr:hypothetical protein [Thermomicrobiales bacterium]
MASGFGGGSRGDAGGRPGVIGRAFETQFAAQRRLQEEQRAEDDRIRSIQADLAQTTSRRSSSLGIRSLLGPLGGSFRRSLLGSG